MSEFSDWIQNNWSELGNLVALCGIAATLAWYGRKILRTMRASQEQIGALLKLSVSDTIADGTAPVRSEVRFEPIRTPSAEPATELHSLTGVLERAVSLRVSSEGVLTAAEGVGTGSQVAGFFRAIIRWFKAPIRRPGRPSLFRRMVRWLQTPAGSRGLAQRHSTAVR